MELDANVAISAENQYEDQELWYPFYRLQEAGADVAILGTGDGEYTSKHGYPVEADSAVGDVDAGEFDAVVIPGGWSPDYMRRHQPMVDFVKAIDDQDGIVAAICHGGWLPASADIVEGKQLTSFYAIRDDMENAGADWVDEEVVRDENLITSRTPDDLPAFSQALLGALRERD